LFEVEQGIAEGSQCLWGTPTQLNAAMKANELDITLVSSIEYLRHKEEWLLLENLSISSFAPVGSVVWIADRPCPSFTEALGAFEHFAVSSSSATSVALFQVLAHELAGRNLEPQLVSCNPHEPRQALAHHGNVLAIGDDALRLRHEGLRHSDQCFDLAELWAALTGGAPFVFGVWVARKSWAQANPNLLAQVQQHLQQQAQRVRTEPAWRQALQRHLQSQGHVGTALLETYWTEALNYELSPAHLQALDRFEALLQRHGLLHTLASPMAMAEG
jgi:chorismate dehydratase